MLATLPAFSSFSVHDVDEAAHFYGVVLGLRTSVSRGMLTLTLGSGASVLVYPKSQHQPATHTVLMFPTDDIAATVAWARTRGIAFEMLDGVGEDGIMPAGSWGPANAWFRDPSGNWLSIIGNSRREGK